MEQIEKRISELYESFQGFPPRNPILRLNQKNDAFVFFVFEVLFQNYHNINKFSYEDSNHRELLLQYVVPPPDDSIDIFFEEKDLDENRYHIVQVKKEELTPGKIENCFVLMENTIKLYLKKPKDVRRNLKEICMQPCYCARIV